ncbi:MAG: DmsE family decaheme c-type cytochrome [Rhodocyclales bacterium]|nr:DmsE family decaheme c-type cytochrome [Rhodocyclales bacterium]
MKALLTLFAVIGIIGMSSAPAVAADAPAPAAEKKEPAKDLILKGDAKCTGCHDEADVPKPTMLELHPQVLNIGKTKHGTVADARTPTCTACHGESEKHLAHKGSGKPPKPDTVFSMRTQTPVETRNAACLSCHQGGNRIGWQLSKHGSQDVACTSCHQIHTAQDRVRDKTAQTEVCFTCHKEQRAQMARVSHHPVPEGKMACSSCHNVHGDNPKQLVKSSVNDTCYTCHMEKRGPFVHNHQPVSEDCSICHQAHGTTAANLLKSRTPFLCQECHSHSSHPGQTPGQPTTRTTSTSLLGAIGRGCLNCHTNIHGSNSSQNSATVGRFRR